MICPCKLFPQEPNEPGGPMHNQLSLSFVLPIFMCVVMYVCMYTLYLFVCGCTESSKMIVLQISCSSSSFVSFPLLFLQVMINSRGLVYSVVLLLGSVALTVSSIITKPPLRASFIRQHFFLAPRSQRVSSFFLSPHLLGTNTPDRENRNKACVA